MTDRAYQTEAELRALRWAGFALLMDMGTGKTRTAIRIAYRRFLRGQVTRVIVVGPIRVKEQWAEEIQRWCPEAVIMDIYNQKLKLEQLGFFITHYEQARSIFKKLKGKFDMMILDEAHKIRRRNSKQSRRMAIIGRTVSYRLLLTGTPQEYGPLDYWSYFRYLEPSLFGANWSTFADGPVIGKKGRFKKTDKSKAWCIREGYHDTQYALRPDRKEEFLNLIAERSYTIRKEDAIDLPPLTLVNVPLSLYGQQKSAYTQMEQDFVIELPTLRQSAELVVVQMVRLQQIAGGFVPDERGVMKRVGSRKLDYMIDVFEDYKKPIVVFARYRAEIDAITKLVQDEGRRVIRVVGGENPVRDPKFDVAIVQISVSAGLDWLKHASLAIMYSKTFSRRDYEQARDRLHRSGQSNPVTVVTLMTQSTIDEDLEGALQGKGDMIATTTRYLTERQHHMAAPKKAEKTAPTKEVEKKPAPGKSTAKYTISTLADDLDKDAALIRVALRKLKVEKLDGRYGWNTKAEYDTVKSAIKDLSKKEAAAAKENPPKKGAPKKAKKEPEIEAEAEEEGAEE